MSKDWRVTFRTRPMIAKPIVPAAFAFFVCSSAFAQTKCQSPPPGMSCHSDLIVWVNIPSHIYHFPGHRCFGCTKDGKFICQQDADHEGDRPTRNEQSAFHTGSTCALANGSD